MEKEQPTVSRIKYKYLKYIHKYPLYTDNDSIIVNIFHEKDTNARYTHYTGIANPIPFRLKTCIQIVDDHTTFSGSTMLSLRNYTELGIGT